MSVLSQQWVNPYDSTTTGTGCTFTVNSAAPYPDTNKTTAVIASATDGSDRANGTWSAVGRIPTGTQGRARFRFTTPSVFAPTGNFTVFLLVNASGAYDGSQAIADVYVTSSGTIAVFSSTTLSSAGFNVDSGVAIRTTVEDIIELAWQQNNFFQLWLNGTLVINQTGLSGATTSGVVVEARVGIDHYDGASGTGFTILHRFAQIADDPNIALMDPVKGFKPNNLRPHAFSPGNAR